MKLLRDKEENCRRVAKFRRKQKKTCGPGRPALEEKYDDFAEAIYSVITSTAATNLRRRNETLRSSLTLKQIQKTLKEKHGIEASMTAISLRFKPPRKHTQWGKRHRGSVNVRARRPAKKSRKSHESGDFYFAQVKSFEAYASECGPDMAVVFGVDDKAKVPLGVAAANVTGPVFMSLERDMEVTLPDHDYSVAKGYKLIPSLFAVFDLDRTKSPGDTDAVTSKYNGVVTVRNCKYNESSAWTHLYDLEKTLSLALDNENLKRQLYEPSPKPTPTPKDKGQSDQLQSDDESSDDSKPKVKPVWLGRVDGGSDNNVRHSKVQQSWIFFFLTNNLDHLYIVMCPPGWSAYNPVERGMVPLSRCMNGVVINPFPNRGELGVQRESELNEGGLSDGQRKKKDVSGKMEVDPLEDELTAEEEEECLNECVRALAELFTFKMDDLHEYIGVPNTEWLSDTVRQSVEEKLGGLKGYHEFADKHMVLSWNTLQISKCGKDGCRWCLPIRSNYRKYLRGRQFMPAPAVLKHYRDDNGWPMISAMKPSDVDFKKRNKFASHHQLMTYRGDLMVFDQRVDFYNPKFNTFEKLREKECNICGKQFGNATRAAEHKRLIHPGERAGRIVRDEMHTIVEVSRQPEDLVFDRDEDLPKAKMVKVLRKCIYDKTYLVEFDDFDKDWVELDDDDPLVLEYNRKRVEESDFFKLYTPKEVVGALFNDTGGYATDDNKFNENSPTPKAINPFI